MTPFFLNPYPLRFIIHSQGKRTIYLPVSFINFHFTTPFHSPLPLRDNGDFLVVSSNQRAAQSRYNRA